jgi:hypothetical protein
MFESAPGPDWVRGQGPRSENARRSRIELMKDYEYPSFVYWTNGTETGRFEHSPGSEWYRGKDIITKERHATTRTTKIRGNWYNNGIINRKSQIQLDTPWVRGRIKEVTVSEKQRIARLSNKNHAAGLVWWYNTITLEELKATIAPDGWVRGRPSARNNKSSKNMKRWTNGIINVTAIECPVGYTRGVTRK